MVSVDQHGCGAVGMLALLLEKLMMVPQRTLTRKLLTRLVEVNGPQFTVVGLFPLVATLGESILAWSAPKHDRI